MDSWCLRMVTIAASCVWVFSMLRKHSWMVHVLLVGILPSRNCIKDSAMSNIASATIHRSSRHPGWSCVRWSQRWFKDHGEGFPKWSSSPIKRSTAGEVAVGTGWDLCRTGYILRCSPWWPDVDRCIGGLSQSLDDNPVALPLQVW